MARRSRSASNPTATLSYDNDGNVVLSIFESSDVTGTPDMRLVMGREAAAALGHELSRFTRSDA